MLVWRVRVWVGGVGVVECRSAWFELVGGAKGVVGEWGGRSFDMVGSGEG